MKAARRGGRQDGGHKASEGRRGHADRPSPAAVERYLKESDFPASKDDLIVRARDNEAPGEVLKMLDMLDDKEYNSIADITREVGKYE